MLPLDYTAMSPESLPALLADGYGSAERWINFIFYSKHTAGTAVDHGAGWAIGSIEDCGRA
jgi:hypothetical protein